MSDLRVTNLKGRNAGEAPTLPDGVVITGIATVSSVIVGTGITLSSSGINVTGVITATSFSGNGSGLTGVAATTLTIGAGTTALPSISPTGDSNTGIFFPAADTVAISEGGTEALRVDSSGRLLVGITTANANGGVLQLKSGITFPVTAVAATDANTLDDYEEGTWTPVASRYTGGNITASSGDIFGRYTKIGRMITIHCYLQLTSVTSQGTGSSRISGIPFNPPASVTTAGAVFYNSAATTLVIGAVSPHVDGHVYFHENINTEALASFTWKTGIISFTVSYEI